MSPPLAEILVVVPNDGLIKLGCSKVPVAARCRLGLLKIGVVAGFVVMVDAPNTTSHRISYICVCNASFSDLQNDFIENMTIDVQTFHRIE